MHEESDEIKERRELCVQYCSSSEYKENIQETEGAQNATVT
jgi:hypothetical protein